ncbi:MAG TPA: class I SAM-dependent methyltransferase [Pyrinomonadaceae bacterium]|jgi:SAM-dependent methyltransferase
MSDAIARFSNRVENYAKYRPRYPPGVIEILKSDCGLTETSLIADVGSGTGFLSELFLKNGNPVIAIEPNAAMRLAAERLLAEFVNFTSTDATAEATGLESASVDFITAGQAFHWFNREKARTEFARILKPNGWVVLIWNERKLDSTPFLRDYENLLLRYGTDYEQVRHENVASEIAHFFAPEGFQLKTLENAQHFDFEGLKGRTRSASYTPEPGSPDFEPMLVNLEEIFNAHKREGIVTFEYQTRVYYGHLSHSV